MGRGYTRRAMASVARRTRTFPRLRVREPGPHTAERDSGAQTQRPWRHATGSRLARMGGASHSSSGCDGPPPLAAANPTLAANLGNDSTLVVVGGDLSNQEHSGGRFTLGFALDPAQTVGLEGTYFFLGTRTTTVGASSSVARPSRRRCVNWPTPVRSPTSEPVSMATVSGTRARLEVYGCARPRKSIRVTEGSWSDAWSASANSALTCTTS